MIGAKIVTDTLPDAKANGATPILPAHIDDTIRAIAKLHADHHQNTTPLQRLVDRLTALLGRPGFVALLTLFILSWVGINQLAAMIGYRPLDPPPFAWLEALISTMALYLATFILTTQRREDQLSELREQLTLELAILSEQKTAKVIQLLEELRQDNPLIHNRLDEEANEWLNRPIHNPCLMPSRKAMLTP